MHKKHNQEFIILGGMPDPLDDVQRHAAGLRQLGAQSAELRRQRDISIVDAFAAGSRIVDIAAGAGLTPARVSVILGHPRGKPGRPARVAKTQ